MQTKPNKAFTIVELLVAMSLMLVLMALASVIFAAAVRAYRTADSTMEIVRRADAIRQQLSADFGGLQKDAPMAVWFEIVDTDGDGTGDTRYDQIQFFANGDFQAIKPYDSTGDGVPDKTVSGLVSRIQYGHAWQVNTDTGANPWIFEKSYLWVSANNPGAQLLSRRTHLLTSDMTLTYAGVANPFPNTAQFTTGGFSPFGNNLVEYDQLSLVDWQNLVQTTANNNQLLNTCFNNLQNTTTAGRPMIDMKNTNTLHLLLSGHIGEFKVQWAYKSEDQIKNTATGETFGANERFSGVRWWPDYSRGDFYQAGFGAYFDMPGGISGAMVGQWKTVGVWEHQSEAVYFASDFYPKVLKFTFTVYDAKGLFPNGRTFTHIVMID